MRSHNYNRDLFASMLHIPICAIKVCVYVCVARLMALVLVCVLLLNNCSILRHEYRMTCMRNKSLIYYPYGVYTAQRQRRLCEMWNGTTKTTSTTTLSSICVPVHFRLPIHIHLWLVQQNDPDSSRLRPKGPNVRKSNRWPFHPSILLSTTYRISLHFFF